MLDSGIPINGKRVQRVFPTLASAESYAAQLRATHANAGVAGFKITDIQREDARAALDALADAGCNVTLQDAVSFYLLHNRPPAGCITLENLREKFLENREQAGLKPRSLHDLDTRTAQFTRHIGGRTDLRKITKEQVADYIQRPGISAVSAKNDWTALHALYQFAMHPRHYRGKGTPKAASLTGWIAENPVANIPKPRTNSDQMPSIIELDQATRLLAAAYESRETDALLAYVSLQIFSGLRPSEVMALDWSDLELKGKHPVVNIRKSKTRAGVRNVTITPLACKWLRLCTNQSGPVVNPINFRRRWTRTLAAAKITEWPQDCLRHTFASVDYRIHQNANRTASLLGHSRAESVLFANYRASMPLVLAKKFQTLTPEAAIDDLAKNVVHINTAVVLPELADNIAPITAPTPATSAISQPRSATA